jgi:hypothetical protein
MAERKKRPWSMQELLRLGPDKGGIDADQFEAGIQVVEARRALTIGLDYPNAVSLEPRPDGGAQGEASPRDVRLVTVYLAWGVELGLRLGVRAHDVAGWVNGDDRPPAILLLTRALDLWDRVRDDHDRAARADRAPRRAAAGR